MNMIFTTRHAVERYIVDWRKDDSVDFSSCVFMNCDLRGLDLSYARFHGACIVDCNFEGTVLVGTSFDTATITNTTFDKAVSEAYHAVSFFMTTFYTVKMNKCKFPRATFCVATLHNVSCTEADLTDACFNLAHLSSVSFKDSDLSRAKFINAKIDTCFFEDTRMFDANLQDVCITNSEDITNSIGFDGEYVPFACPAEGSFVAWKACRDNLICKVLIPEDAKRSSAFGKKCRASKFKVLEIYYLDVNERTLKVSRNKSAKSKFNSAWVYKKGETYEEPDFDNDRFNECAPGLHFFMDKQDAINYLL